MTWTSNGSKHVACNGQTYDVSGVTGKRLVARIKEIAKENSISKFDLYDASGASIEASQIESGEFSGNLTITKYNVAA